MVPSPFKTENQVRPNHTLNLSRLVLDVLKKHTMAKIMKNNNHEMSQSLLALNGNATDISLQNSWIKWHNYSQHYYLTLFIGF